MSTQSTDLERDEMITREEILMGRDTQYPLSNEHALNLRVLLARLNYLRTDWGRPMVVSSGYRPGHYNKLAGGATKSTHLSCEAVDIRDPKGELAAWLTPERLVHYGLYMENPSYTKGWVHLDIRVRNNRIFNP